MTEYFIPVEYLGENENGVFEVLVKCVNRDNNELQKVSLQVPVVVHNTGYTCTAYTAVIGVDEEVPIVKEKEI